MASTPADAYAVVVDAAIDSSIAQCNAKTATRIRDAASAADIKAAYTVAEAVVAGGAAICADDDSRLVLASAEVVYRSSHSVLATADDAVTKTAALARVAARALKAANAAVEKADIKAARDKELSVCIESSDYDARDARDAADDLIAAEYHQHRNISSEIGALARHFNLPIGARAALNIRLRLL